MRKTLLIALTAAACLAGCVESRQGLRTRSTSKPILVDEYSALDDRSAAGSITNQNIRKKLEEARRHYLLAMRSSEQGKATIASEHFESAIAILNDLVTYPNIDSNPEFVKLSESLIRDYEEQITSLDSLDANSSFFVLRDKIFQEIETIPLETGRRFTAKRAHAGETSEDVAAEEYQIAMSDNAAVQQCIAFFTSDRGRKFFSRWLERSGRFFPVYERIFAEEGVPQELKYLSMIESGLSPAAVSWAKAVGLWQFIPGTGKQYGLTINWWVDERRDPEKATRAAARFLKDLYNDLGDWHLALASYNCGPNRVKSAIAKANSRDYWQVRNFLPRETQQYVPLYIAAAKIASDPEAYGFTGLNFEQPDEFATVTVKRSHDLQTIADLAKISVATLKALNPELLRDQVPEGIVEYKLRVPHNTSDDLAAKLEELPNPEKPALTWTTHKVRKGESLAAIADKYNVPVADLCDANRMAPSSKLRSGMKLRVPVKGNAPAATEDGDDANLASNDAGRDDDQQQSPTAAPQQTKERQSSTLAENSPAPGRQTTQVSSKHAAKAPRVHVVGRGETLYAISRQYGVSVDELAQLNKLGKNRSVRLGQRLKLGDNAQESTQIARDDRSSASDKNAEKSSKLASKSESKSDARNADDDKKVSSKKDRKALLADDEDAGTSRSRRRGVTTTSSRFETHKVKKGESLIAVAEKYGVSVDDLKTWNAKSIKGDKLAAGASLKIYSESPSKGDARRSSRTNKSAEKKYTVRKGESLAAIADKFGVSLSELRKNNPSIKEKSLRPGQVLRIQK